ncbi:MAG TPA: hypothetical protein VGF77_10895 [Allosphingosinicella sp.]|jgi:hypothetical protein
MKKSSILVCLLPLSACSSWLEPPQSIGDVNAGFRYVAIDPLPVSFTNYSTCTPRTTGQLPDLLDALHDLASRVSTQQIDVDANAKIPVVSASASGNKYEVTEDFIAYDETNLRFEVPSDLAPDQAAPESPVHLRLLAQGESPRDGNRSIIVPVYVGVGLRLTAEVTVLKGNISIAGLGALAAAVNANRIRGSMVAQSLGLTGPKIATIIPLSGDLNATTVQNAAVAIGSIKALIYTDDTQRWPRVVGIHYPFAKISPAMVNAIVSALAAKPVPWKPCDTSGTSN